MVKEERSNHCSHLEIFIEGKTQKKISSKARSNELISLLLHAPAQAWEYKKQIRKMMSGYG